MSSLLSEQHPLWARLKTATAVFVGIDYDGTLAPFCVERMAAVPFPGAVAAIRALLSLPQLKVAIVSGRPLRELDVLLGNLAVDRVGCHGFEFQNSGGERWQHPLTTEQQRRLQQAEQEVLDLGAAHIERKSASVAFHTRGLQDATAQLLQQTVAERWVVGAQAAGLALTQFAGGLELRALGADKGTALRSLLQGQPEGTIPLYLGDDLTDEDAFAVVQDRGGVAIRVGPTERSSCADAFLPNCEQVVAFLGLLHRCRAMD